MDWNVLSIKLHSRSPFSKRKQYLTYFNSFLVNARFLGGVSYIIGIERTIFDQCYMKKELSKLNNNIFIISIIMLVNT